MAGSLIAESPAFVAQFADPVLGNSAHLVGSKARRVAALIDPLRDADRYMEYAEQLGVTIAFVLETHLHNDFVSGAREVAAKAGAIVAAGRGSALAYDHRPLAEGDRLELGDVAIRVLETPGHTPEHVAYALEDGSPRTLAVFTGGALMVGGAARTDLLGPEMTEPLARTLFHTIHEKLLALPDEVAVFPTHGPGSFCAAPAGGARSSTIGRERTTNPLALAQSEDEFVRRALAGLPSYPTYFGKVRPINQKGPKVFGGLPDVPKMSPADVQAWIDGGGAVLDVRPPQMFVRGHIPGVYGIAVDAPLGVWAGWLIPFGTPLVLVTMRPGDLDASVRQLVRIGYDDLRGTLDGGMAAWEAAGLPIERVPTIPAAQLRAQVRAGKAPRILDVRQDEEWADGHLPGAIHVENGRLPSADLPFGKDEVVVVHCHFVNRSTSGISVLARRGYRNLILLDGGYSSWEGSGFEVVCDPPPR